LIRILYCRLEIFHTHTRLDLYQKIGYDVVFQHSSLRLIESPCKIIFDAMALQRRCVEKEDGVVWTNSSGSAEGPVEGSCEHGDEPLGKGKKVKISLLQAVEAHRVARGQGSHIT
jgi:hypothetical protein